MEFKEELELLLNNFIITKENNKDAYYKIKSKIKKLREFTTTKLGCDIISNSLLIKLEKMPSIIDNTFKIDDFNNRKHYVLLMLVIMFLEDKAQNEQFIMSNLTSYIENIIPTIKEKEVTIDFKDYLARKKLVDVLKYMIKLGAIKQIDGDELLFKNAPENEVLYENTGVSHYIVRQFKDDIFGFEKPSDFLNTINTEYELNKKRYYTYRTLLFYPIFHYKDFEPEIYSYFINYRNRIATDIKEILDGDLLIYDELAMLTTEEKTARITFPNSRKMIHDIILLVNDYLIKENNLNLNKFELEQILNQVHKENNKYFSKEFREMQPNKFFIEVVNTMEKFGMIKKENDTYYISPIIYLISGNYPKEEINETPYEQLNIELEV